MDKFPDLPPSWLLLGKSQPLFQLAKAFLPLNELHTLQVLPLAELPLYHFHFWGQPVPTLGYGHNGEAEAADMFVFQLLSRTECVWQGLVVSNQSPQLFLAFYLARYLKLPVWLWLQSAELGPEADWLLSTPQLQGVLLQQAELFSTELLPAGVRAELLPTDPSALSARCQVLFRLSSA